MKKPYLEDTVDELLWYSFERDVWFMRYTVDHWADMKKAEYFSQSWMTIKESSTPISEEKKTSRSHERHEYRGIWLYEWDESITSIKGNEAC